MALTLAESAKLSTDMILAGVIETVIKEEHILDQLPFVKMKGQMGSSPDVLSGSLSILSLFEPANSLIDIEL